MQYRVKEQCGLCGKTLLLRPHLKTHKIKTWDEYISKLKEIPKKQDQGSPLLTRKETPSAGLNSLLRQISSTTTSTAKCSDDPLLTHILMSIKSSNKVRRPPTLRTVQHPLLIPMKRKAGNKKQRVVPQQTL